MRKILFLFLTLFVVGCNYRTTPTADSVISPVEKLNIIYDTICIHDTIIIHDTINNQIDSLKEALFVSNFKLARIKAYCDIVDKNPKQVKYLKGWIYRVIGR